jgi:hypothetical protein
MITLVLYIGSLPNLTTWLPCGRGRTLFILGSLGQRSRSLTINRIFLPFDNLYRLVYFVMHTFLVLLENRDFLGFRMIFKVWLNQIFYLWPNDPKINRVLPLPQGNHVVKFGKDPIYRTKLSCGNDSVVNNFIYSNGDFDLMTPK